jgi:hypothetical protein
MLTAFERSDLCIWWCCAASALSHMRDMQRRVLHCAFRLQLLCLPHAVMANTSHQETAGIEVVCNLCTCYVTTNPPAQLWKLKNCVTLHYMLHPTRSGTMYEVSWVEVNERKWGVRVVICD